MKQQFSTVNNCSVVFTDVYYIFFASDAYNICRDCFSVFLLFQSHAAVVKRYNDFFVQNLLQTVTSNRITSANQHFLHVLVNIFTFNELWNVTFCHKPRRLCNVRRQNSCNMFYKVV